ncbi:hypothetical protein Goklo_008704 [Gossypium klotzschianum]|uniref:Uncharacterized protein n=1 Tax=Gossypium klotzschianum TaxID=34286 RepID=A0A7J8V1L4_9ROSI|nr:hypothetical protein [Gossypium klotzschianum]
MKWPFTENVKTFSIFLHSHHSSCSPSLSLQQLFFFRFVHQPPPLLLISVSLASPPNPSLVISSSLPSLHFEEAPKSSFPILSRYITIFYFELLYFGYPVNSLLSPWPHVSFSFSLSM